MVQSSLGVVPVLVGPLQVFFALLPYIVGAVVGGVALAVLVVALCRWRWWLILPLSLAGTVVVGGIEFGVLWLGALRPSPPPEVAVTQAQGGGDWPAFRGGPLRRGFAGGEDPTRPANVWRFDRPPTYYASPSVVGNRVYITSADKGVFADRGEVLCLDADTGAVAWRFAPADFRATFSSPAVAGGYLVVGEGLHYTEDSRVFCLKLLTREADGREGYEKLWDFRTHSHVESSPCIDLENRQVYIGSGDDGYWCFALDGDGAGGAQVVWHLKGSKSTDPNALVNARGEIYADAETGPAYADGRVYFGLGISKAGEDAQAICCVDAKTGKEIWRYDAPAPVFCSPSVADGRVYAGMGHGDFINPAEKLGEPKPGQIVCLDAATGAPVWPKPIATTSVVLGCIAVRGDRLFFGDRDGEFYCASAKDGSILKKTVVHSPIIASPAVADAHVYFVPEDGVLHCLDAETLKPAWQTRLGTAAPGEIFISSPAVARGHVYVGTAGTGLLCLGEPGEPLEPAWIGHLGGAGVAGRADGSPLPQMAQYAWRFPGTKDARGQSNPSAFPTPPVLAPVAAVENRLLVGCTSDAKPGLSCVVIDGKQHEVAWECPADLPVALSPVATRTEACFVSGPAGAAGRVLRCVDMERGTTLWQLDLPADAPGELTLVGKRLAVLDRADQVGCYGLRGESAGKRLWGAAVGQVVGRPAVDEKGNLVVATAGPRLAVISPDDGGVRWIALEHPPTTGPLPIGGVICYGDARGLQAVDADSGRPEWSQACGPVVGSLSRAGDWLAAVCGEGLLVLNVADTVVQPHAALRGASADPRFTPMLASDGDRLVTVVYCSEDRLSLRACEIKAVAGEDGSLTLQTAERVLLDTARGIRSGPILSSPVMLESCFYYGTEQKGMVCATPR